MLNQPATECNVFDISQRSAILDFDFDSLVPHKEVPAEDVAMFQELSQKQKERQGMDVLPYDLYNQMLANCCERRDFRSVFWFTAMANLGLRYSDVAKLRRIDFIDENGRMRDSIVIQEQKTKKQRVLFINKAVKMALLMHLWNGDFSPTDYLIVSQSGNKNYKKVTYINDNGKEVAKRVNGKYVYELDEYGRTIPMPLTRRNAEILMKKIIIEYLGVALKNDSRCADMKEAVNKICTHSIRKMYGKAVTDIFIQNFDKDVAYAHAAALSFLSQDYGHSSEAMTLHYSKDFEEMKRGISSQMNLGGNIIEPYFVEEMERYEAKKNSFALN